ncbi:cell wall hydrolase [Halomonas sp. C05BenzN]|uniref:cell wall hydrolase n=1 Tax=Halomonas sp. C05BenzN TaxID=3411041 RepID=UPI003B942F2B
MACLAVILLAAQGAVVAREAIREERAEAATSKAEELEQAASPEGDEAAPPPAGAITRPEVQAVDPSGDAPLDEAITCLSRTIYWEAKGEEIADMEAVANVVMNRLGHEGFPDTICEVVTQGSEQGACQFSWWCDGRPDHVVEEDRHEIAREVARQALNQQLPDRTGGALYFHQREVWPSWAAEYIKTVEVGEFVFYKPYGGASH